METRSFINRCSQQLTSYIYVNKKHMKNILGNRIKIQNLITKFAEEYLKEHIDLFPGDKDMENMFKSDYKNIIKIGNFIEKNNLHLASKRFDELDTIVREKFPQKICDFLAKHTDSFWAEVYKT